MLDQVKFMETLRAVAEVARVSTLPLSKEEINGYFEGMELTDEQQELVYQYLLNPQTEEPEQSEPAQAEETAEGEEVSETPSEESVYLRMYMEELQDIPGMTLPEEREAYVKLIDGDSSVMQQISDHWLNEVVNIAKTYQKHKVNIEDAIQEGNVGLIMGIQALLGSHKMVDVQEYLKESIQKSIEDFIDEMNTEDDWESTVLAKTTLIHEAKNALAAEIKREPSIQELSDYTRISVDEIEDILHLSLEDEKSQKEKEAAPVKDASIDPWFEEKK